MARGSIRGLTEPDYRDDMVSIEWRSRFGDDELNALHADAFDHVLFDAAWNARVERWSLGWVTARQDGRLVGFVNVLTDGGIHAWVQDVIVATTSQRRGVGTQMMSLVRQRAAAAGCEWIHVDFDAEHADFYLDACDFTPTSAGLVRLGS